MAKLLKLKIITDASPKWRNIGILVGIKEAELENIEGMPKKNTDRLVDVFSKWKQNSGKYPATWMGLQKVLLDSELAAFAERIKEALPHLDV